MENLAFEFMNTTAEQRKSKGNSEDWKELSHHFLYSCSTVSPHCFIQQLSVLKNLIFKMSLDAFQKMPDLNLEKAEIS